MAISLSNVAAQAACNAVVDLADGGTGAGDLLVYGGIEPTDADTAIGAQVLLGTLALSATAFSAAVDAAPGATATAAAITDDTSADATGTASFFRVVDGDGTVIWQGTCGTSGQQLNLVTLSIVAGQPIQVTSFTHTQPES